MTGVWRMFSFFGSVRLSFGRLQFSVGEFLLLSLTTLPVLDWLFETKLSLFLNILQVTQFEKISVFVNITTEIRLFREYYIK